MSWILWAQVMGMITWAGVWARYVMEAPRKHVSLTGAIPISSKHLKEAGE